MDQLCQGSFYGGAGDAQVFGHGGDGVPALAIPCLPGHGGTPAPAWLGAQLRIAVDLTKIAHGVVPSFFGVR